MTDQPNPYSRESAAESAGPQPSSGRSGPSTSGEGWPTYPAAPNSFGYDRDDIGAYGAAMQPPADPYVGAAQDPHHQPVDPYPTYPAPNPYASSPTPAYGTSPYGVNPYGIDPYVVNPYGVDPYGVNPYGSNPYGGNPYAGVYGHTPTNHPQAVVSLVLGVIGLAICSYIGIAALLVGHAARRDIRAQPLRYSGLGMATAGWVMGIVGTVLSVLITLFLVLGMSGALG